MSARPILKPEEKQLITLLCMSGKKTSEIMNITGRSSQSIHRVLDAAGIVRENKKVKALKENPPEETPVNASNKNAEEIRLLTEIAENTRLMVNTLEKLAAVWIDG